MEEEEKEGIKVVDKRRFTNEGDTRAGDFDKQKSNPVKDESAKASFSKGSIAQVSQQPVSGGADTQEKIADGEIPGVDFSSFVISLATQALALLGEIPDPQSGKTVVHLEGAKQLVDILGVLQDKTRGNLSQEEDKLLGDVLSSLRLTFVKKVSGK